MKNFVPVSFVGFAVAALSGIAVFADNSASSTAVVPAWFQDSAPEKKVAPSVERLSLISSAFSTSPYDFRMTFNAPVSADAVAKNLTISPALPFSVQSSFGSGKAVAVKAEFVPGETYTFRLGENLSSEKTRSLGIAYETVHLAPDLPTRVDILSSGTFLPLTSSHFELALALANPSEKISVETRRVFPDRVVEFFRFPYMTNWSQEIFSGKIPTKLKHNELHIVSLDLEKIGIPRKPGIYTVRVLDAYEWRTICVTDLATQVVRNGNEFAVSVRKISDRTAVADAEISVVSRKFRVVAEGKTDAAGFAKIECTPLADAEDAPAYVLVSFGDDKVFQPLSALRGKRGSGTSTYAATGTTADVFAERGICRPGEDLTLFASLRGGENCVAQAGVPAEFSVVDPAGETLFRLPVVGDEFGFYKTKIAIPRDAVLGSYSVIFKMPGQTATRFGTTSFSVGEYVPDTFAVGLSARAGDGVVNVSGNANYYFGSPLANGKVSLQRKISSAKFSVADAEDFDFGYDGNAIEEEDVVQKTTCDANGKFSFAFKNPARFSEEKITCPLRVGITATVAGENGGRSVSARAGTLVHYAKFYAGSREKSSAGATRVFEFAAFSPDGKSFDISNKNLVAKIFREEWNVLYFQRADGKLEYDWQKEEIEVAAVALAGAGEQSFRLNEGGSYVLRVLDADGDILHERKFFHYFGETGTRGRDLGGLAFSFDREKYEPGETAKISFNSAVAGEGIIVFGNDKILGQCAQKISVGKNEIFVAIPAETPRGNHFFSVTVFGNAVDAAVPQRAFGVGVLPVDQTARKIFVKTDLPDVVRPGEKTKVKIQLSDANGKPVAGNVQLWAVDRGVLALTGFETPDIFNHFFGTKFNCPYLFGDTYGEIYPWLQTEQKIGGGAARRVDRKFLDDDGEEREKSAVVVLDIVRVSASGEAETELAVPASFDGGMRLMAIALNEKMTGSAEKNFVVRNPVSVQLAAPRAVAFGDEFEILVEAFNSELPACDAAWKITTPDAPEQVVASGDFALPKNGKAAAKIRVAAGNVRGNKTFDVRLRAGDIETSERVSVLVRSPFPAVDSVKISTVAPGETALFENAREGCEVFVGAPAVMLSGAMEWLRNYPYGCVEQITATAFPLLAVEPLIRSGIMPAANANDASTIVRATLSALPTMRLGNGFYSMWAGGKDAWIEGSLFAMHFRLEAVAAGFSDPSGVDVRNALFTVANDRTQNIGTRVYATYLLALAGEKRAEFFAKLFLLDNPKDPFLRFLAGATLVRSGHAGEGMEIVRAALAEKDFTADYYDFGAPSIFASPTRRAGTALYILAGIAPNDPACARLAEDILKKIHANGHWGTTHANAWATLGLARWIAAQPGSGTESGEICVDGKTLPLAGSQKISFADGKKISVKNTGSRSLYVFARDRVVPTSGTSVQNRGFKIERIIVNAAGEPVNSCEVGDLLTVRTFIRADDSVESVVVCDMLPGGLEIEDETLLTRVQMSADNARKNENSAFVETRRERRFDRFLAFGDFWKGGSCEISYRVRAVSRGSFVVPPAQIEAMYDGERHAVFVPEGNAARFEIK